MGKTWIAALVTGLLLLVGAGAGGFVGVRALKGTGGPVDCGQTKCLPVKVADMVKVLQDRGFDCSKENVYSRDCELQARRSRYGVAMEKSDGFVQTLTVMVDFQKETGLSDSGQAYLHWASRLPFPQDQDASNTARAWVDKQVRGSGEKKALINSFEYLVKRGDLNQGFVSYQVRPDPKLT